MDAIAAQVQALAENADESNHNGILTSLRDLQYRLEKPMDTFMRIYNSQLQVAVLYVGVELGLFKELAKENAGTVTVEALAGTSGASPDLLERLLRYLAAVGYVANVGPGQFQANKMTHVFADPLAAAGIYHGVDTCGPAIGAFPSFLAETNYQDLTSNKYTPFQKGHSTELSSFQWLIQQPKLFGAMQQLMTALQSSDWIRGFDLLDNAVRGVSFQAPEHSENPFFVDVGGGHGHQCVQLRDNYPTLQGHLVLQDLPHAVDQLPPIDGVKIMAQDFFEKQGIEGANFYYLRRILHDWPNASCVKILQNLAAAMTRDSRILVDEIVLPNVNAHSHAAIGDISMGILFGGKERTRKQWETLVSYSGLHLVEVHTYSISLSSSIIVLALP